MNEVASMMDVEEYLESLYESLQEKIRGTALLLQLSRNPDNLEELSRNGMKMMYMCSFSLCALNHIEAVLLTLECCMLLMRGVASLQMYTEMQFYWPCCYLRVWGFFQIQYVHIHISVFITEGKGNGEEGDGRGGEEGKRKGRVVSFFSCVCLLAIVY